MFQLMGTLQGVEQVTVQLKDKTQRYAALGAELPGHGKEQSTKAMIVRL